MQLHLPPKTIFGMPKITWYIDIKWWEWGESTLSHFLTFWDNYGPKGLPFVRLGICMAAILMMTPTI